MVACSTSYHYSKFPIGTHTSAVARTPPSKAVQVVHVVVMEAKDPRNSHGFEIIQPADQAELDSLFEEFSKH